MIGLSTVSTTLQPICSSQPATSVQTRAWTEGSRTTPFLPTSCHIPEPIDLIVCDASFIALSKVLPVPMAFAKAGARLVALIKPQFEAERHEVGKKGVVRDAAVHARVCSEVRDWLERSGWRVVETVESPITGPEGNVEFLIAATKSAA